MCRWENCTRNGSTFVFKLLTYVECEIHFWGNYFFKWELVWDFSLFIQCWFLNCQCAIWGHKGFEWSGPNFGCHTAEHWGECFCDAFCVFESNLSSFCLFSEHHAEVFQACEQFNFEGKNVHNRQLCSYRGLHQSHMPGPKLTSVCVCLECTNYLYLIYIHI